MWCIIFQQSSQNASPIYDAPCLRNPYIIHHLYMMHLNPYKPKPELWFSAHNHHIYIMHPVTEIWTLIITWYNTCTLTQINCNRNSSILRKIILKCLKTVSGCRPQLWYFFYRIPKYTPALLMAEAIKTISKAIFPLQSAFSWLSPRSLLSCIPARCITAAMSR